MVSLVAAHTFVEKLLFVLDHYAQLVAFLLCCLGIGAWIVRLAGSPDGGDRILHLCLSICAGMGGCIVTLQALGMLGLLTSTSVGILLIAGFLFLAAYMFSTSRRAEAPVTMTTKPGLPLKRDWFHVALALVLTVELILRPLAPPLAWDELMYHLPHAREWAFSGKLQVNEALRFPLFPYNFNLLYAASLTVSDDILPHLLHAMAGALVAIGLYRVAARFFSRPIACVAALFFVAATRIEFGNGYVDLGLTAFLFFGLVCLLAWYESGHPGHLFLAAFLFGVAAGIKHQALVFAPFVLAVVLWRERRPARLACFTFLFFVPCIYWYLRSYLVSGDPVHPLGASLFGYWLWSPQDSADVVADIRRVYGWPHWTLMTGFGAVLFWRQRSSLPFWGVLLFSCYAFVSWMLTSHYPRYLLPAYPALCLLSAIVVCHLGAKLVAALGGGRLGQEKARLDSIKALLKALFLFALCIATTSSAVRHWRNIQPNEQARSAFLRERIQSYEIAEFLRAAPGFRIVQIGLESDMYYLPPGTKGDVLGPARSSDLLSLAPADLAARMRSMDVNALLISGRDAGTISRHGDFAAYFEPVKKTAGAELYRIK